jgi:hypothetical protein
MERVSDGRGIPTIEMNIEAFKIDVRIAILVVCVWSGLLGEAFTDEGKREAGSMD